MNRRDLIILHTDKKLLLRLRLFLVISLVMLGIIVYDFFQNIISFPLAVTGIGLGVLIGLVAGRMFKIHWHEEENKVVSRLDELGIVILILYIGFAIFRGRFFGTWIHGPLLTAFTFAFFSGTMFGRFMTMGFSIRSILYRRGIFR